MKKISNKIIIAISLIVIACVIYYFQNVKEYKSEIPMSGVIIAKEYIPENTIITKDMILKDARHTQDLLKQKSDITSKEENILGKRTRVPIYKDEPIHLQRLIENQPYMDDNDNQKKTMFAIAIQNLDKALDIKKGSYIDLWIEPNANGLQTMRELKYPILDTPNSLAVFLNADKQFKPFDKDLLFYKDIPLENETTIPSYHISQPMFKKIKVYDTKTEIYTPVAGTNADANPEGATVTFLTLYLTDEQIATYLDVKDWDVEKRISLYGENVEYSIISEKLEDKQEEVKEDTTQTQSELNDETQNILESPTN